MKKHFTAGFLCLSIIAAVCGCKSNKDITESNAYSSVATGSVGSSTVSETEEINTAAEITNSSSSSNTSVKSEASGCKHDFRSLILPPNCTTGGYTEHRCQDCGYEYISCLLYTSCFAALTTCLKKRVFLYFGRLQPCLPLTRELSSETRLREKKALDT